MSEPTDLPLPPLPCKECGTEPRDALCDNARCGDCCCQHCGVECDRAVLFDLDEGDRPAF